MPSRKKEDEKEMDIETFLELQRTNVSFKERYLLDNWNSSVDGGEIEFETDGCRVMNLNKTTSSHKTKLISKTKCPHNYIVLTIISSHVQDFNRRMLIRKTWGSDRNLKKRRWKTYFVVGLTTNQETLRLLSCEKEQFSDIIYGDVYESFDNLTFKMQIGFEWAVRYCKFKYLLKTESDVFVNIPKLLQFLLHKDTQKRRLYAGYVQFSAQVMRSGKYAVSKKQYRKAIYPRYCSGGGFVLTSDVVKKMLSHFSDVDHLRISDAYVGELALKSGIDAYHDESFQMSVKDCGYHENAVVYHPVTTKKCTLYLYVKHLSFIDFIDSILTRNQLAVSANNAFLPGIILKRNN